MSLARHVQALYPLARVLAGSDRAEQLIRRVYEHAAAVPPEQRPSDERGWLFRLMTEAHGGSLHSAGAEVHPEGQTSFTDDPFRREVAAHTAERSLPAAFAACSIHERFILAVDVLADPSDEALAAALDTTTTNARSVRDQARSSLRASLRDVLTGPERMLVDVALPDDALRALLHDLLADRFHPPPSSLHSDVVNILASETSDDPAESSSSDGAVESLGSLLRSLVSFRSVLVGMLVLGVLGAGIGGVSYVLSSRAPTAPQDVVAFAAERAGTLELVHETSSSREAEHYVQTTWGRRVSVPSLEGADLRGVGRLTFDHGETVPAFLFSGPAGDEIAAFAFNYALIDELDGQILLPRTLRNDLAANETLLSRQEAGTAAVLWRQRDDIFVVVAPHTEADSLRSRIRL